MKENEVPLEKRLNVEIPTLKSLYIEMYFGSTRLSSGTATLVALDKESDVVVVTNRHNVTGRNQQSGKCLDKNLAEPDHIVIYFLKPHTVPAEWIQIRLPLYRPDGTPFWVEHPRLKGKADIVGLNLKWGADVFLYTYYLRTQHDRANMIVGPAETVSVIGFPFGEKSSGFHPIWMTGFLAQDLCFVTPDDPVFLIDCRTRQGQSGSPVIAYRPNGYRHLVDGQLRTTLTTEPKWEFLGIYSGRVNAESDLGMVWHISAVEELVTETLGEKRRRQQKFESDQRPE